ncbi:MAG TPA: DUF4402 domain-containing protein [Sphingomicrobium sp.]|jgi:hypothetical protein
MASHARLLLIAVACLAGQRAEPARAATQSAAVQANIIKPLTLTSLQNLDLGTITLKPGSWTGATVSLSRTGALTCANANVICSGATRVAQYNVTGTNKMVVRITAPDVTLVNSTDPSQTLKMVVDAPASVALTSSGAPGNNFELGGSITLSSTTAGGDYTGTFDVIAEYQ